MKDTATLKELLAIVVRQGKTIVVIALVIALLFGAIQTYQLIFMQNPENSPKNIELRYQTALEEYEISRNKLQIELENNRLRKESYQKWIDSSIWLTLNPYDVYLTTIQLSITNIEERDQVFETGTIPVEYMTETIQNQYIAYWNALNLQEELQQDLYPNASDKELRELLVLTLMPGGGLTLQCVAGDSESSAALASIACARLKECHTAVVASSYNHSLSLLAQNTKNYINESIATARENCAAQLDTYATAITELETQLAELQAPTKDAPHSVKTVALSIGKWMFLGFALGVVIGVLWAVLHYLFRSCVETSRELEEGLSIDFLGNAKHKRSIFERCADGMIRERAWADYTQATDYIRQNLTHTLDGASKIVLLTTLKKAESRPSTDAVMAILNENGRDAVLVTDANHNPHAAELIRTADKVILAESTGESRWSDVADIAATVTKQNQSLCGFVVI